MSYSLSAKGKTVPEVLADLSVKLEDMVKQQSFHEIDKHQAFQAAESFADLMQDAPDGKVIVISINGSGWSQEGTLQQIGVGLNVSYAVA